MLWIMRYSWWMLSLIFYRYCGTFPNVFFYSQFVGYYNFLALDRMFSIALVTTKSFPDLKPIAGFYERLGTESFLYTQS
jgi:hypothetical protein